MKEKKKGTPHRDESLFFRGERACKRKGGSDHQKGSISHRKKKEEIYIRQRGGSASKRGRRFGGKAPLNGPEREG